MNEHKLTKATLICALLIIVGAGHGIAPIGLFELTIPFHFEKEYFSTSFDSNYDHSLLIASIISFLGQVILVISIFINNAGLKFISLIFLWVGFAYLVHDHLDAAADIGFFTGIPFLIISIMLFFSVIMKKLDGNKPELF